MKFAFLNLFMLFSMALSAQITEIYDSPWLDKYVNGKFIFSKYSPVHGTEIWATDGTAAGTNMLFDIVPGTGSSNPNYLTVIDNVVYFQSTNTNAIWRTDGTAGGTYQMASGLTDPRDFIKTGGFILFRAGSNGSRKIWKMQTTPNSHFQVSPVNVIDVGAPIMLDEDNALFSGKTSQWGIWRTNGNVTSFVIDIDNGNSNNEPLGAGANFSGNYYFSGYSTNTGFELWRTDGTSTGTILVKDIQNNDNPFNNSSAPSNFQAVGNTLYFTASNTSDGGRELYKTTGISAGLVKDIYLGSEGSNAQHLTSHNSKLYFVARDNATDFKIWTSDGTSGGTMALTNNDQNTTLGGYGSVLNKIPFFNNGFYYNQNSTAYGYELWRYNLSNNTSELVQDYNAGTQSFYTYDYFVNNNQLFFSGEIQGASSFKMYKLSQTVLALDQNKDSTNTQNQKEDRLALEIYPNPTHNIVNIKDDENKYFYSFYDTFGQAVFPKQLTDKRFDFGELVSGTYFMLFTNKKNKKTVTRRIVKQ